MKFDTFNLHKQILKALESAGYTTPTDIQARAIPEIQKGSDIRASAQTGTGKTAAFLLPAINKLTTSPDAKGKGPRILILAPTRELAMQIATQSDKYSANFKKFKSVCVCGGVPYHFQNRDLSRPYEILIATPGRLIDFLNRGKINLGRVETLILDEADRMLDMGFMEPVEEIVAATPADRQTLLFSATLPKNVLRLSQKLLNNPVDIVMNSKAESHENITQKLLYVDDLYHKNRLLDKILEGEEVKCSIIFTATKRHADQLVDELKDKGHNAQALHGDMSQRHRTRTIELLRKGKFNILVATDVAARGIDVQSITHVINFDLPRNTEDYVHRIGRTGRAGAKGTSLSFAAQRDFILVKKIEEFTGQKITTMEIPGMEPKKKGQGPGQSRNKQRRSFGAPPSDGRRFDNKPRRKFPRKPAFTKSR